MRQPDSNRAAASGRIGYFVNAYPKISHTFIRREIEALETLGSQVVRYALRSDAAELVDPRDVKEYERTNFILAQGWATLVLRALAWFTRHPVKALRALALASGIGWRSERGLIAHYAYVIEAATLASWCARDNVSHLHAHFGTNSATVAMLANLLGGPGFSFTAHGADEIDQARTPAMAAKLRRADFVAGVSAYVRSQLLRVLPYHLWDRVKLVRCGLDDDYLANLPPALSSNRRFVCVGRLCVEKAQPLLVEAVGLLRDQDVRVEVVLAGDGPMRPDVEQAIARLDLWDRVRITGWLGTEAIRQELSAARFFVLPSLLEGLPVAIMEAMALGRPVISTYVAGIPELVENEKTGWLVPAADVAALARAMRQAVECSDDKVEEMGRLAREKVGAQHDVRCEARKLAALFRGDTP